MLHSFNIKQERRPENLPERCKISLMALKFTPVQASLHTLTHTHTQPQLRDRVWCFHSQDYIRNVSDYSLSHTNRISLINLWWKKSLSAVLPLAAVWTLDSLFLSSYFGFLLRQKAIMEAVCSLNLFIKHTLTNSGACCHTVINLPIRSLQAIFKN